MIESVFSVSDDLDPIVGIRRVVADCRDQLGDRPPHAGIFFTSCLDVDYAAMLVEIHKAFPGIELIGCTTDGEITPQQGFTEESSALIIFNSETIRFSASIAEQISGDTESAMRAGFDRALAKTKSEPAAAFVLPDGITTMPIALDEILESVTDNSFPVFGGSAGDGFRIIKTYQFLGTEVYTDAMPIMLLEGNLDIAVSVARGPLPYGDFYSVEKLEGNKVFSIDGVTALEFYERFLGQYLEDREVSFFPLAVYVEGREDFVLRDPVEINRKDGSISFVGRFEEPCSVRLTQVTREETLQSANIGSEKMLSAFHDTLPELVLLFSCTSRRHVLGSRTKEEFSRLKKPENPIPFFGFYCYGEIGPFSIEQPVKFHSDTCVFVALKARHQ